MNIQQQLERELSSFLGLKNTVLFSSCRNALYTLLLSLPLQKDDEVIIQSFICDSLPQAIEKAGGKAVLAEVHPSTFNLDPEEVQKNITKKTKAVVFVHTYGNPSGVREVQDICKKNNILLIEDIAHALGASEGAQLAGTFGDYAIYSFTKQLVNFGGGALITNHDVLKICELRDALHKPAPLLSYMKRLMASLYETRAFFLSKIMIDIARRNTDLKMVNSLDKNFRCSLLEAYVALPQIKNLHRVIQKKRKNYLALRDQVPTQNIATTAVSSYNYLSLWFESKEQRDRALAKNFLFLPPWRGSRISGKIIFIPNNPSFSKRKVHTFINSYQQATSRSNHGK